MATNSELRRSTAGSGTHARRQGLARAWRPVAVLVILCLTVAACSSSKKSTATSGGGSNAPGVTATSIKIGLVTSISGPLSSSFGQSVVDAAKAQIDAANAAGGINGRKIDLVVADDASTAAQAMTAVQSLVSQKVFGILAAGSPFDLGAYRYAVKVGIPVTGTGIGSEWGDPANKNLFGMAGSTTAGYQPFTEFGQYFKTQGGTKLAALGYSGVPSSSGQAKMAATSAEAAGLTAPYVNTSVALTSNDFTAIALAIKAAGADSLFTSMATASNVALIKALKNAGVNIKVSFITAGYQQSLLADPATAQAVEGYDFQAQFPPWILNTAATQAWSSAMATYANYHDPNPLGGHHWGWFTAALMVFGLQKAGTNLTWASFISNLRSTTDYTAGGLIPEPVDFTKFGNVGQASENNCFYMTTVAGGKFQMVSQQPYCGTPVPGTH